MASTLVSALKPTLAGAVGGVIRRADDARIQLEILMIRPQPRARA